ncbi:hypothetical protein [Roseibium aggregatum]|uniref:Uncharacterized protein n=1 Tax=Roseibium aggregatum TaxID=187304 RepID=A0A939EKD5_9HYPH|nr:hypothetical protein [Roseibium aggregatum]MBN9673314.1 hypothetical protein [Roseibium aggregatum]
MERKTSSVNAIVGLLLCLITLIAATREWGFDTYPLHLCAHAVFLAAIAVTVPRVRWGRKVFVIVALGLSGAVVLTRQDWPDVLDRALVTAEFVAAFFCALSTLGNAAASSPAIVDCGRYLAGQPPGRRYAALTVGGQLFSLLLNYGAIALLGNLAVASAKEEKDPEIREHRTRRMLLAIERAFVSTLPWSPLSFAFTFSSVLIAGVSWTDAVLPCFVTGLLLAGSGWLLDTIFKPKLSRPRTGRPQQPAGSVRTLGPLLLLLVIMGSLVFAIHLGSGIRVPGIVIVVVPLISIAWIGLQNKDTAPAKAMARRSLDFARTELPVLQSQVVLLTMAGFIGIVGGALVDPLVATAGIDLHLLPPALLLVFVIWIIPAMGQLGMNPLLAISLLAPLLPPARDIGLEPTDLLLATTGGWALSGISSPFTAMSVVTGSFAGVSARHVALRWNGLYLPIAGALVTFWVLAYALL